MGRNYSIGVLEAIMVLKWDLSFEIIFIMNIFKIRRGFFCYTGGWGSSLFPLERRAYVRCGGI